MRMAARDSSDCVRARALLIAAVLFISYAYFYEGGGWNQNSRFDLIRAIIEQRTLRIDAYHGNTGDKALYQGHYYSDKAPGLALLALPAVAAVRPILRMAGVNPVSPRGVVIMSYFATLFAVSLPTALACSCLFLIALRLGSTMSGAAFAAFAVGLATPVWAWATLFWGHALTGSCLVFGLAAAVMLWENQGAWNDPLWSFAAGLAAGWATVSEYPAAPASGVVAVLALALAWSSESTRRWRVIAGLTAGVVVCLIVLMIYQRAAFGSSLHLGYSYYEEGAFPWMKRGFMGLTYPRVDVMLKLLFSCRRGILLAAPLIAVAPLGLWLLWKQANTRSIAVAVAAVAAYYFLFNASFYAWHGGWSYGPRYLGAAVPVLGIGLAPLWSRAQPRLRRLLAIFAICGAALSLMAVSTTAQPPLRFRCPVVELLWPSFWAGKLSLNQFSFLAPWEEIPSQSHGAFNLGELAGLHGLASLIPLLIFWAIAAWVWWRLSGPGSRSIRARTCLPDERILLE